MRVNRATWSAHLCSQNMLVFAQIHIRATHTKRPNTIHHTLYARRGYQLPQLHTNTILGE
jgi:hypothetical protein